MKFQQGATAVLVAGGLLALAGAVALSSHDSTVAAGAPAQTPPARNAPAQFTLDQVIRGWTEGVQLMVVGEKRRFWIPGALAYDNIDRPGAPKGPLVFDIELLDVRN